MNNTLQVVAPNSQETCINTDNGYTDTYGYGCYLYTEYPSMCGNYDDYMFTSFSSMQMCCACGGGTSGNITDILFDIRR